MNVVVRNIDKAMTKMGLSDTDKISLVVALSGGADSVALLRALLELGYDCMAAHCNFHLRGEESNRDEQFVARLCHSLGVKLMVKDFDVQVEKALCGGSTEMACRKLRYEWFLELQQQLHRLILVAHHADDNVETFFLNLFRGTGIHGLTGMSTRISRNKWPDVLRPMLTVTRAQVLQYLDSIGQEYVIDSTNNEDKYKRNNIRNVLLPEIDKHFPGARQRVVDTMSHLSDECRLLDYLLDALWLNCVYTNDELTEKRNCHVFIPREMDLLHDGMDGMLLYSLLKRQGFAFKRSQCDNAMKVPVGARFDDGSYTLIVCRDGFEIQRNSNDCCDDVPVDLLCLAGLPHGAMFEVVQPVGPFSKSLVDGKSRVAFSTELLRCERVVLRHWREGDRMRPFGMRGTKLLSDLFVDLKLSPGQKKAAWLLEADGKILWVLGYRAAHEFVVTTGAADYVILQCV